MGINILYKLLGVKTMARNIPPLIIEHYETTNNLLYMAVIEYKKNTYLSIIDNIKGSEISAYVLDAAEAENIDIDWFLTICTRWYYENSEKYPLSIELHKMGYFEKISPIIKTFKMDNVSRLAGKIFIYDIYAKPKVKRKKVNRVQTNVIPISFKK